MPRRFRDVLNVLSAAANSSWWRVILAGLLVTSLVSQTIAGPHLAALGLAAMAGATIISGPIQFAALGRSGLKALGTLAKAGQFWWIVAGSAVFSAGVTLPFSMVANKLPLGLLVPIMGAGLLVVTIIENLPGSRGLRRALVIFSPLLTAAGFALFAILPTSGAGPINPTDLLLAGVAATSLACFTIVQGRAAKLGKDERDTMPGQLVMALANLIAGVLLLSVALLTRPQGHLTDRWLDPWLLLQVTIWGVLWMAGPTLLNMVARTGLKGLYPALQQLGTPTGMLVQVFVQHKPASTGAWIANLLITFGSVLLALEVNNVRVTLANRRLDRAKRRRATVAERHQVAEAKDGLRRAKVLADLDKRAAQRKAVQTRAEAAVQAATIKATAAALAAKAQADAEQEGNDKVIEAAGKVAEVRRRLTADKAGRKAARKNNNVTGTPPTTS